MKALQQSAYGPPLEVVALIDVDAPTPGPTEIVVEVEAAAMHLADLKFINGDPGFRWFEMPRTPGHEGLGRVVALGDQAKGFEIGDRAFLPVGAGTFCQKVAAKADDCTPAPEGDEIQLVLMSLNAMTAFILVNDISAPAKDEWIIQNGANSSCGRFVIAIAKKRGAKTVNIVRRPELIEELKAAGADAVIVDAGDPDATAALVKEATGGADIRCGFDCVASTGTVTIARCLRESGTVINYGFMTGKSSEMAFQDLFLKSITLQGMNMSSDRTAMERKAVLQDLANMTVAGELEAKIAGTYTLEQAQEAFAHQARTGANRQGKIIILPNG
ncbi:MAG: zinc-dependent alcohol dehydrogenase family protein [Rhodospirillaceae bacterium]|jgi:mitochondrial enoyl-[acyl-carrier protein] reductase / trans-2-enoyl-CoA reductase|nr:zinc-dependent alcohol dehydrogenase family protein [Rhodospirillaceae bacterium]